MRKSFLWVVAIIALTRSVIGAELAPEINVSPNKQYSLTITRNPASLVIQAANGKKLFSSVDVAELRELVEFDGDRVLWSPDARMVAIAGGDPRYMLTYVFIQIEGAFVHAPVPSLAMGYDNPWVVPQKWTDNGVLVLDISGPHAGKAVDGGYQGEAKIRVSANPPKCETLSERIKESN